LLSVPDTVNFWRMLHGCGKPAVRRLPHRNADDPSHVVRLEWTDCASATRLRFYRVVGGGHRLPSIGLAGNPAWDERLGVRNRDIETADEVWAYFKDHRR
jgi:polyhydroxybutyrate depolymerase